MRSFKSFYPTPFVFPGGLTIRGIGLRERMRPGIVNRPRGTGDCLFMFFYDPVDLQAGDAVVRQPPERLILWDTGHGHYYGVRERPWLHSWIHADGAFLHRLVQRNGLPWNEPFSFPDPALMERHLLGLHEELTEHGAPESTVVHNLLENWLVDVARTLRRSAEPPIPPRLLTVRRLLDERYTEHFSLAELAETAHCSPGHFCEEFKRCFGVPPMAYAIRLRLHHAAYLLQDRNISVAEAARRVGYEDLYYFSRLFKKHYGASPRAMRTR